jgi:hypothetical protein
MRPIATETKAFVKTPTYLSTADIRPSAAICTRSMYDRWLFGVRAQKMRAREMASGRFFLMISVRTSRACTAMATSGSFGSHSTAPRAKMMNV